jgi:hypothetical protein
MSTPNAFCPICEASPVTVETWDFSQTSVSVPTCDACADRTFVTSVEVKTSAVQRLSVKYRMSDYYRVPAFTVETL